MEAMAHLGLTLLLGTAASLAVFKLSVLLYERVKSPLLNPLLVTVALIIAALVALRIPLESYEQSVQLISFLLGRPRWRWPTRCTASARRSRTTSFPSSPDASRDRSFR